MDLKQTCCSRIRSEPTQHSRSIAAGPEMKTLLQRDLNNSRNGAWWTRSSNKSLLFIHLQHFLFHSTYTNNIQGSIFIAILCLKFNFFLGTFSFDLIEVGICEYSLTFIPNIYPKFPIHIPFHSHTFPIHLLITLGIFLWKQKDQARTTLFTCT